MTSYVPFFIEWIWVRQKVIQVTCRRHPTGHKRPRMALQRLSHAARSQPMRAHADRQVFLPFRWGAANGV